IVTLLVAFGLFSASALSADDISENKLPHRFFRSHCLTCHSGNDAANGLAFDDIEHLATQTKLELEDSERLQRALKVILNGQMPPKEVEQPTQEERKMAGNRLHHALIHQTGLGGTLLRRLSRSEYTSSIQSLFGFDYKLPNSFPEDRVDSGFDNSAKGLVVSAPLLEAYFNSAIEIADKLIPPASKPPKKNNGALKANDLVISYSSGAVIDGSMRLAFDWNVLFRSTTWPEKWESRQAGTYRIRVRASQLISENKAFGLFEGPMKLEIRARSLNGKDSEPVLNQRLLKTFEVTTEEPQDFEFIAELYPQETPVFFFANGPVPGDKKRLEALTLKMFQADPRLYAGWKQSPQTNGGRGGLGWSRVKAIRDSDTLDLEAIDTSESAVAKLAKTLSNNPGNYGETMVFQFYEEGPALELHAVTIEGPLEIIPTPNQLAQRNRTTEFLGKLAEPGINDTAGFDEMLTEFYDDYLSALFRRPATKQDISYFTNLTSREIDKTGDVLKGIHLGVRTSLMSPQFLYRGHRPGALDDYDLAARLSFFLANGPPDTELLRAAAKSELKQPEILTAQAKRLLSEPQANQFISEFVGQWLGIQDLADIMPDPRLISDFKESDAEAMVLESERFFQYILSNNLPIETFISANFTIANERLAAKIYGLENIKGNFKKVQFPAESPYGGILGQASVMMATANGVDTLPVTRGVWVLENILGDAPPAPPDNVPAITPDTTNAKTIREILGAHRADKACASCHRSIDPIGFTLENFDPVGRWRRHYPVLTVDKDGTPVVLDGLAIDPQGNYKDGTSFKDVRDLKLYIVNNIDMFSLCLAKKLTEYATGRHPTYAEISELKLLVETNRESGNGFQSLLLGIVNSQAFKTK
ncbi:MAG: DUF1592 domain-containing protein, partial [Planctomycetota bacterium]|nr:DUF1592 domain-containing protein [Planctomycetota bacterium]